MARKKALLAMVMFSLLGMSPTAQATELVHHMVNPAFGGSPLNGSWLLGNAQAQDTNKDHSAQTTSTNSLTNMTNTLNSTILSILSQRIASKLMGDSGLPVGTTTVGDFSITVQDNITNLSVTVSQTSTGQKTSIQIPQ
jgi:curli production assembly/transport component CsgF